MSNKFEWWVGLFTALAIASILFISLRVSNFQVSSGGDQYKVYAYFDEIGGLKPRAPITMAGVVVGRVGEISLDVESFQAKVVFNMNSKYKKIPDDTSASILTAGILGEKYIGLTPGGAEEFLENEGIVSQTQSAIVLENLISKFLLNSDEEK
jgi:phospholipid/cholesterol/gamma-HCH transport system substrate-binding protein